MQNEPNFLDPQMNVTSGLTTPYETAHLRAHEKNKPNQSQLHQSEIRDV
jgi:hypothetical protein